MRRKSTGEEDYIGDEQIAQLLHECRLAFDAGDKSQLFRCTTLCGQFQKVIPAWAVEALLAIRDGLRTGRVKDFNHAFGEQVEPVNTRAARARKQAAQHEVLTVLMRLRLKSDGFTPATFGHALDILRHQGINVNLRDIQEIYAANKQMLHAIPRKPEPHSGFSIGNIQLPTPRRKSSDQ